jgi:hypothetical protein
MEEVNQYCLHCGDTLHILRLGKKYCSSKCRQTAYHHRQCGRDKNMEEWQSEGSQPKFAELTVISAAHGTPPLFPQIEVLMNNGNRLLFYQIPGAEFVKHIVA